MVVPPALSGWFRSAYPSVRFNPDWLEPCAEYSENPGIGGQTLIKAVEAQLLASDLSTSTFPPQTPNSDPSAKLVFATKTLLQLVSLDMISHPAHQLLETLKDKREAAHAGVEAGLAKKEEQEAQAALPAQGWQHRQGGPGAGEDGPEEDKIGEFPAPGKGTGRLVLSDGHEGFVGMEYRPLGGWCGLDKVKLGSKVMVHNVRQAGGVLLLDAKNCTLKGGDVQEWDAVKDYTLENLLRARLRQDLLPPPGDQPLPDIKPPSPPHDHKPAPAPGPASVAPTKRPAATMTLPSSGDDDDHAFMDIDASFDDGYDEDAFAAMDQLEQDAKPRRAAVVARVADSKPAARSVGGADVKPPVATTSSHFGRAGAGARAPLVQGGVGGGGGRASQGSSQDVKPRMGAARGPRVQVGGAVAGKRKVEVIDLLDSSDED